MTSRLTWLTRVTRKRWLQVAGVIVIFAVAAWSANRLLERMVAPQ